MIQNYILWLILILQVPSLKAQPKISFTFDDGSTKNIADYKAARWNDMILEHLRQAGVKGLLFVRGKGLDNAAGNALIKSWGEAGHGVANHSYAHMYFNSDKVSLEAMKADMIRNDSLLKDYVNFERFYRFPYLKEGNTAEKVEGFRAFLDSMNYINGHVSIDASDWYIESRMLKKIKSGADFDRGAFKAFYLEHLWERAQYYEKLSYALHGRHISHTLLLHHNLCSALFLDDLMAMFRERGWEIVDAVEAYKDPVYRSKPNNAGESIIWSLAKDSGRYDDQLRYPAEDSRYEKDKMDALGL